jgi:hypothetical protein
MIGFSAHDWTRQDRLFERGLTDLAPPLIEDGAPIERPVRLEAAPGIGQSPGVASSRTDEVGFARAADRTSAATPHPGRGGSSRGDRGTAPAPEDR